jgi:hypothetical protein
MDSGSESLDEYVGCVNGLSIPLNGFALARAIMGKAKVDFQFH